MPVGRRPVRPTTTRPGTPPPALPKAKLVAKKTAEKDRKARVEEMRKAQQAAERRKNLLVVVASLAVVAVLVAAVFAVIRREQAARDIATIGATAAAAACDAVITDKATGGSVHVGPGTDQASRTTVDYATVPPTSGEHYVQPAYPSRAFYTAADRPRVEELVHNLEHGYTIVWYSDSLPQAQQDELKRISDLVRADGTTAGKFIVSAWDSARGAFPAGKQIGISHWGKDNGYRRLCGSVSGEVIKSFVEKYPYTDSPEPNAA